VITAIFGLLNTLIRLYIWALILAAVYSMLVGFNVLDTRNRLVWTIGDFLYRVTEPALRPIRHMLPSFGGFDISPVILILLLEFIVQPALFWAYRSILYGEIQPVLF
jgi:YggT family protein